MLIFALASPAAYSAMQNAPDSITITEKDNGRTVKVALGGTLTLKLEAIPGTGYAWKVVRNDTGLLKPLGESIFEPTGGDSKKGPLVGTPENQILRFRAQGKGTDILELHYMREWRKEEAPQKMFSIIVQIQ